MLGYVAIVNIYLKKINFLYQGTERPAKKNWCRQTPRSVLACAEVTLRSVSLRRGDSEQC